MGMFQGLDLDIFPGVAALEDAKRLGYSWIASYLPAPSHHDAGWPAYPILEATGLNIWPVWVGAQVVGPGSHAVGPAQGKAEGLACVAALQARQYPPGIGVVFDTENGKPLTDLQQAHLGAWAVEIRNGGFRAMAYGSYENFDKLAALFGAANVWEYEVRQEPPEYEGLAVQWAQEVPLHLAGIAYSVDRSVSSSADPAFPDSAVVVRFSPMAPPAQPTPIEPPLVVPPPSVPAATKVTQAGPPIAAALTAAATAAAGAVHLTGYQVDLSGLVDAAAPYLIAGVLLPSVVWLIGRALQYFHVNAQSTAAQFVVTAVENAVRAEATAGLTYVAGRAVVTVNNQAAGRVLDYVDATVPKRLAASGITPEQLAALVTNRLAQVATPGATQ